jgi:hypothetical protein
VPEITRFYGIVIKMFFRNEHNPPHIHVVYNDYVGLINIKTMKMFEGDLSSRTQKLVKEWGVRYQDELMKMWLNKQVKKLPGLE